MTEPSKHTDALRADWKRIHDDLTDLYRKRSEEAVTGRDSWDTRDAIAISEAIEAKYWQRYLASERLDAVLARPDLECLSLDSAEDRERLAEILREGLDL